MGSPGRRERKKQAIRRAIAQAALRQFSAQGFDATTVAGICDEADVAVSTFYVYYESKEAAAFPDADARADVVERVLAGRPANEQVHATLRRAAHAIVEEDLGTRDTVASRALLVASEPRLAAFANTLERRYVDRLAGALAGHLSQERGADLRARVAVSALFGALNAVWAVWRRDDTTDLHALVDVAYDLLDGGLSRL
jgi:AcrR family transcriptional regulator